MGHLSQSHGVARRRDSQTTYSHDSGLMIESCNIQCQRDDTGEGAMLYVRSRERSTAENKGETVFLGIFAEVAGWRTHGIENSDSQ